MDLRCYPFEPSFFALPNGLILFIFLFFFFLFFFFIFFYFIFFSFLFISFLLFSFIFFYFRQRSLVLMRAKYSHLFQMEQVMKAANSDFCPDAFMFGVFSIF